MPLKSLATPSPAPEEIEMGMRNLRALCPNCGAKIHTQPKGLGHFTWANSWFLVQTGTECPQCDAMNSMEAADRRGPHGNGQTGSGSVRHLNARRLMISIVTALALVSLIATASAQASDISFTRKPGGEIVNLTEPNTKACERSPSFGRVVIRNGRHKLVLETRDICEKGSWRSSGNAPGVRASAFVIGSLLTGSGVGISIDKAKTVRARYRVIVRTRDGRATGRIAVYVKRTQHVVEERIYEGTDAFVNYCIDQGQEIRSHDGRLFCWRVGAWETVKSSFAFRPDHRTQG